MKQKDLPKKKSEIEIYVTLMSQSRGEQSRASREGLFHKVIQGLRFYFVSPPSPRMFSVSFPSMGKR